MGLNLITKQKSFHISPRDTIEAFKWDWTHHGGAHRYLKHSKEENTTAHRFVLRPKYGIYYCVCAADAILQCHFQRRHIFVLGKGMLRAVFKKIK